MMCDNVDCDGTENKVYPVEMKEEFEGGTVYWCKKCIARDNDMIVERSLLNE